MVSPAGGQRVDPFAHDLDIGVGLQRLLNLRGEHIAVHRHGRTCRHPGDFARAHDQGIEPPHLVMQQADRVLRVVVGTKAVRTDQFGQRVGLVGRRHVAAAAHFRQADFHAAPAPAARPLRYRRARRRLCEHHASYPAALPLALVQVQGQACGKEFRPCPGARFTREGHGCSRALPPLRPIFTCAMPICRK